MATLDETINEIEEQTKKDLAELEKFTIGGPVKIVGGNIYNETPEEGFKNPRECDFFTWACKTVIPENVKVSSKTWYMHGDFPYNCRIGKSSGVITGELYVLNDQRRFRGGKKLPKMLYSGSNWKEATGRPDGESFTFEFNVELVYTYTEETKEESSSGSGSSKSSGSKSSGGSSSSSGGSTTSAPKTVRTGPIKHIITMSRSYNVDNYVIAKAYLQAKEQTTNFATPIPSMGGATSVTNQMDFLFQNHYWVLAELKPFTQVHPGPWPNCEYQDGEELPPEEERLDVILSRKVGYKEENIDIPNMKWDDEVPRKE